MLDRQFLDYMKFTLGKSENTINSYAGDLKIFYNFLKAKKNVTVIDEEVLRTVTLSNLHDFTVEMVKMDNAPATRARRIATLKSFFKYLKMMKVIPENITLDLQIPKIGQRVVKSLTLDESKDMLSEIKGENSTRDLCILTVLLHTGVRVAELCSINIDDINKNVLRVIGKGNKERTIPLDEDTLEIINEYLQVRPNIDSKALFISERRNRLSIRAAQEICKKYLRTINKGDFSAHKTRSTFATLLYENEVDLMTIKELLGHNSVATTQKYVGVSDKMMVNAVARNPLNKKVTK